MELFFFFLFAFACLFFFFKNPRRKPINPSDFFLSLYIKNPDFSCTDNLLQSKEGLALQEGKRKQILQLEKNRILRAASGLILPFLLCLCTYSFFTPLFSRWNQGFQDLVLQETVTLEILSGIDPLAKTTWTLSTRHPTEIYLQPENLLLLQVSSPFATVMSLTLQNKKNGDLLQSFQMNPSNQTPHRQSLSFSMTESAQLSLPELSKSPYAYVTILAPVLPVVTLSTAEKIGKEWLDTRPLALSIRVDSPHPLHAISLQITTPDQTLVEPIQNFTFDQNTLSYVLPYKFFAESFLHEEQSDIELVALAEDFSSPTPAIGKSKPIKITFVSSYSRYQKTLQELAKVKEQVDGLVEKNETKVPDELIDLVQKVRAVSEEAPFFDVSDRGWLQHTAHRFSEFKKSPPTFSLLYDLSQEITLFLDEHEFSDDRQRDRDFFVAAHSLSQLLSKGTASESTLQHVFHRTDEFLQNRYKRWERRVGRLTPAYPVPTWEKIKTHTIEDQLRSVLQAAPANRQAILADLTVVYRTWIEELEKAEDAQRADQEKKREEGLVSARNELREIQQMQGEISTALNRADQQALEHLTQSWPSVQAKETQAIQATKRLAKKIKPFSTPAAERLQVAAEAMERTLEKGDAKAFSAAESYSHLANRILRQAKNASQEGSKSRKRKQSQGGKYHGQSIHGGDMDLRHAYRVDERYREALLRELQEQDYTPQEQQLIDPYLRKMIR